MLSGTAGYSCADVVPIYFSAVPVFCPVISDGKEVGR
jgi:hypothetical protein